LDQKAKNLPMDRIPAELLPANGSVADEPLAESIFRRLLAQIYDGSLVAGALLNEASLAEEYHVSRGPVREAMRRLQGFQLVTREPYQRARVVSLTGDFVKQLFEVRMALEGVACNLAAQRMKAEDLQRIGEELEQYRTRTVIPKARSRPSVQEVVFDFHERVVRACGNERIVAMLCGDMYHLLRIYRKRSGAVPERRNQAYQEHWQILRALQARDGPLAESLMRTHISRAADVLFSTEAAPGAANHS
jgi:DNA-binding GntR family transcriptional regulator